MNVLLLDGATVDQNIKIKVPDGAVYSYMLSGLPDGESIPVEAWNGKGGAKFSAVDVDDDDNFDASVVGGTDKVIDNSDLPAHIAGPFYGRLVFSGSGQAVTLFQSWFN